MSFSTKPHSSADYVSDFGRALSIPGVVRPLRIPICDPGVEARDLEDPGNHRVGTSDDEGSPVIERHSSRRVDGAQPRGVHEGEITQIDDDESPRGSDQGFGKPPTGACVEFARQGKDATTIEIVTCDAEWLNRYVHSTLALTLLNDSEASSTREVLEGGVLEGLHSKPSGLSTFLAPSDIRSSLSHR